MIYKTRSIHNIFPEFKKINALYLFFSISLIVLFAGVTIFSFRYLLPGAETVTAQSIETAPVKCKSLQEVHIADNGMVYLQGVCVESKLGTSIVASTSWNDIKMQWTILTNHSQYGKRHFGTSILNSKGEEITIDDISVGDVLDINGVFDLKQSELSVKADVIRTIK